MSLFQGFEIGKRALLANQLALNTAGHNIANVNTPGYTRQRVKIQSSDAMDSVFGPLGMGVDVTRIEHIRDLFLNDRWRGENQSLGRWSTKAKTLSQIESFFNEPQDSSLGSILNDFWSAWQDLANKPEAPETRRAVIQQTHLVTNAFHQLHSQLSQLGESLDVDIRNRILEINNLGRGIADINRQIGYVELGGDKANDLRDRRDQMIDELSQFVEVNTREDEHGRTTVSIGSMAFVDGTDYWPLEAELVGSENTVKTKIVWQDTTVEIGFFNGEMKGLLELRDQIIPQHIKDLNTLSRGIVESVNAAHRNGYTLENTTGINFFNPHLTDADQITVNVEVENNPNLIAASLSNIVDAVGDGSNAVAIADVLKTKRIINDNTATVDEFYSSIIGTTGIQVMEANDQTENYTLLVQQLENARQSVQGVSLDEEMANMMKFQHAYDAAARVITTMDEALSTLITKMGIVGR